MPGSSSPAKPGTYGARPNVPEATTTLSHRNDGPSVVTRYSPSWRGSRGPRPPRRAGGAEGGGGGRGAEGGVAGGAVGLGAAAHLVLGRIARRRGREPHPGQARHPGRAVEPQRVPVTAPVVAHPPAGVEDHELPAAPGEVVAGGQAGLTGPDHHGLNPHRVPVVPVGELSVHVVPSKRPAARPGVHAKTLGAGRPR